MSTETYPPDPHATGPARSRRRVLAVCAAAVAVAAVVLVLALLPVGSVSVVSGWLPVLLFWVTVAVCMVAVVLRRDVLHEFAIGIPIGIVFAVLLFLGFALTGAIPAGAPRSMYIWLTVACLMTGLVLAGWHRAHWPRRISGILAVVLAVLSAGSAVNQTFQYYPTFDRLFGKTANHFLDNAGLAALRAQVAKTGQLPDHGATLSVPIPGTGDKFTPRPAYVWVPPAWFARNQPQLPVIELLHGVPGDPSDWTRAAYADATALAFAEQHHGTAPILVMPDSNGSFNTDTECVNSTMFGNVETYLTKTVPTFMQKNFGASTAPGSFAIAGFSAGATCAVTLALNNPKQFSVFAMYAGYVSPTYQEDNEQQTIQILFGGSQANYNAHNPPYILAHQRFTGMAGWFTAGAQDPLSVRAAVTLQKLASDAGIATCISSPPGAHDFAFFKQAFVDSLPWLSWKLKLTPQPPSVPASCAPGQG
jgi:S-formylglutathione hydrolase FrmB